MTAFANCFFYCVFKQFWWSILISGCATLFSNFLFFPYNFLSFSYNSLCCSTIFSFFYNFLSFAMLRTVSKQQFSRLCILFTGSLRVFCSIAVSEHTIYDDFNHCPLFAGLIIATSLCLSSAILITSTKKTTMEFCALFVICITWVLIRWVDLNE